MAKRQDDTLCASPSCLDRKMFANPQVWAHATEVHRDDPPVDWWEDEEAESARNTIMSSQHDHIDQAWQHEQHLNPFSPYQASQIVNNMPMMMSPTPTQIQDGRPFVGIDVSRDPQTSIFPHFLANYGQSSNPLDRAGCLDLTSHTSYEAVSLLNGGALANVLPSSPDPFALAASTQWAQDLYFGDSLLHVNPQQSLHEASYQYLPIIPAMQIAALGFRQEPDLSAEGSDEPRTIRAQHAQIQQEAPNTCHKCKTQFRNKAQLNSHASQTQHATYACNCGGTFSRLDILNRHLDKSNPKVVYTCPYCPKYSDHRLDHVTQHIRGYHHIDESDGTQDSQPSPPKATSNKKAWTCLHEDCAYHSSTIGSSLELGEIQQCIVFQTRKELTQHLREVHDESRFPCTASGCHRIGRKGFYRQRDQLKHQKTHSRTLTFNSS